MVSCKAKERNGLPNPDYCTRYWITLADHIRIDEISDHLAGVAANGEYHIGMLRLNWRALVENRLSRQLLAILESRLEQTAAENASILVKIDQQNLYIS